MLRFVLKEPIMLGLNLLLGVRAPARNPIIRNGVENES
jgi:hypothetical protein